MRRSALTLGVLIAIAVVAAQVLLIPLFAGPAANLAPRDLPIAIAGPPQLAARLAAEHPGAFDIKAVADPAAADAAIRDRDVYGAIVVTAAGPEVHVASAASPTVALLLTQAASALPAAPGGAAPGGTANAGAANAGAVNAGAAHAGVGTQGSAPAGGGAPAGAVVPVRDVVPVDADDARGAGFAAGFLPLAITSLLAGILIFFFVHRRAARLTAVVTFAAGAGLAGAAVQQGWLGIVPGDYFAVAGGLALVSLAISGAMTGLAALLDRGGLALGAVVMFLVGNALSGIAAAPEMLPQPWGAVGQWLPIGAGGTLLRSIAYFDGRGAGFAAMVLTAYALGGLLLILLGRRRLTRVNTGHTEVREVTPELVPAS